jgi:hypothetical protein
MRGTIATLACMLGGCSFAFISMPGAQVTADCNESRASPIDDAALAAAGTLGRDRAAAIERRGVRPHRQQLRLDRVSLGQ